MAESVENWLRRHAPIKATGEIPDGTVIGDWRVAALVARGGSGEVYRAVHCETGQIAALKILHRDDDAARARFAREIRLLSDNRSPFLPAFYGAGDDMGRPWYAMEFLEPFPPPSGDAAVASFLSGVCRAVAALHARGFVHRDIKPANILSRKGVPVLIDLGLAKATGGPAVPLGPAPSIVDGHAVGVGTPGYSAPEQFTGGDISPAADIHALGVLASTCFGGRPPGAWRKIIRRATSSLPDERYRDCAAMVRAIRLRHFPLVGALAGCAAAAALVLLVSRGGNPPGNAGEKEGRAPTAASAPTSPRISSAVEGVDHGDADRRTGTVAPRNPGNSEGKGFTPDFVAQCRARAEAGDAEGQALYGRALANGWGVEPDYDAAVNWLQKAASAGNALGQTSLGECYKDGKGVKRDIEKAVALFHKAAEQGFARAQCYLGFSYGKGMGVEKSYAKSVAWHRKAAEQGFAMSQNDLGFSYMKGLGVEKDPVMAVAWYRKAAEQGHALAQCNLGGCYMRGLGVEKDAAQGVEWFRKAAEQGFAPAQNNLGYSYEHGIGVEKDPAMAVAWYRKAAEQGNREAKERLAAASRGE